MSVAQTIKEIISQGENQAVEFKSADVRPESIAKEFVAFSNSQGGVILIGVDDDGKIAGIGDPVRLANIEAWLANIARENMVPAIEPILTKVKFEEKWIVKVDVPKGKDKPYQTNKHQFVIRVGSTNRIATQSELMRLFQQSGVFHYDRVEVDATAMRDLNMNKLDQYFNRYQIDISQEDDLTQLLINSDILGESGQATLAGLLIFGLNPQRYLPNTSISFAHFTDIDISDELIDKQVIEGNLDYQVDTALAVIKHNISNPSIIKGSKTVDTHFKYEDKVFRELIVNACVHRNYAILGSRIRIFLFSDRIEFISPGRLPNTISIEKLKAGVSYASNPVIVKFMENMRYIDKLGRGLPMVYLSAVKNHKEVVFEEIGEEFRVRLYL